MAIDLLALEPTVITRDLSNKYILLAAPYKYGKTTFMSNIPGALVLSFEPGLNARAGVYAQKISSWSELKLVARQLKDPAVMEKYKCVCFDTIEIAAGLCQDFICARAGVQALGEVPYGKLYKEYENEFSRTIRSIAMLGYGCLFACHTEVKEVGIPGTDKTIERLQPKLDKRAFDVINGLVDIIGIGVMEFDEKGNQKRMLYTNETPTVKAGNRFTYFPPVIDFSYQAVLDNLSQAIEAEGVNNNAKIVDKIVEPESETLNYNELIKEAKDLWNELVHPEKDGNEEMARTILKKIEMAFGRQMKLSEITEDQVDILQLVVIDMRELANK